MLFLDYKKQQQQQQQQQKQMGNEYRQIFRVILDRHVAGLPKAMWY